LMEILVLLALLVVITDFTVRMVRTFGADIPRSYKDFQANVTVQDMLRQLRRDVEGGLRLEEAPGEVEGADRLLSVTLPEGVVWYDFADEQVSRGPAVGDPNVPASHVWPVPHAVIAWRLAAQDDAACALEITTCIERNTRGRREKKLRNSHVFFMGAGGAER